VFMKKEKKDLSREERQSIYKLREAMLGIREIARRMGRNPSTISREFKRAPESKAWGFMRWYDRASQAQEAAEKRRRKSRFRERRLKNDSIRLYVYEKLNKKWTPERISKRIAKDLPGESVSYETIYQFIYKVDRELIRYLPRRKQSRCTNRATGRKSRKCTNEDKKKRIDKRAESANIRSELGHNESDLIVSGKRGKSCLCVLVDRRARRVRIRKVKNREANTVRQCIFQIMQDLPPFCRRSLTVDNGSEHAELSLLEPIYKSDDFSVYYCYPYRAWERGTVENFNGLIRRWFPKGTNFDFVTDEQVAEVEEWINNLPFKCLGGLTPNEVFAAESAELLKVA